MPEKKCTTPEPTMKMQSRGGTHGATVTSTCANCGRPIEKHHGNEAKKKEDSDWHHA